MANTYANITISYTPGPADPLVTITATVNGIPNITITMWLSVLQPHLGNAIGFETFISPLLLVAVPPVPVTIFPPISGWSL